MRGTHVRRRFLRFLRVAPGGSWAQRCPGCGPGIRSWYDLRAPGSGLGPAPIETAREGGDRRRSRRPLILLVAVVPLAIIVYLLAPRA
ncbi:MAG: hypothetical protein ACR2LJ_10125 [Acidimicrobiales bacterium]